MEAAKEARAKVGDVLAGRYELREPLGAGAPGRVFRAWDRERRQVFAVKVFAGAAPSAEALRRHAEALRGAATVGHAALVLPQAPVGAGSPRFVVSEALKGADLEALLARGGALPFARAAEIASVCAEALATVHEATGFAHRALKPGNVWITEASQVRVLDFGVAELGTTAVPPRAGNVFVEYRAPEQIEGAPGDARSDVFTLAVLLFEMATGVHPFTGPSAFKAAHKALQSTGIDLSGLPAQARPLLTRALARRPEERFGDLRELLRTLTIVRQAVGTSTPRITGRKSEPHAEPEAAEATPVPDSTTQLRVPVMRVRAAIAAERAPTSPTAEAPEGGEPPLLGTGQARATAGASEARKAVAGGSSGLPSLPEAGGMLAMPRPHDGSAQVDTDRLGPAPAKDAGPEVITERSPPREGMSARTGSSGDPVETTMALPELSPRRDNVSARTGYAAEPVEAAVSRREAGPKPDGVSARTGPAEPVETTMALPESAPKRDNLPSRTGSLDPVETTVALPEVAPRREARSQAGRGEAVRSTPARSEGAVLASDLSLRTRPDSDPEEDAATTAMPALSERAGPGVETTVALDREAMGGRPSPRPGDETLALPELTARNDMSVLGPRHADMAEKPGGRPGEGQGARRVEATVALSPEDMSRRPGHRSVPEEPVGAGRAAKSEEEETRVLPAFGVHLRAAAERDAAAKRRASEPVRAVSGESPTSEQRRLSHRTLVLLNVGLGTLILVALLVLLLR